MTRRSRRLVRAGLALPLGAVLLLGSACAEEGEGEVGITETEFTELEDQVGALEERVGVLEDEVGVE